MQHPSLLLTNQPSGRRSARAPLGWVLQTFVGFQVVRTAFNIGTLALAIVPGRLSRLAEMAVPIRENAASEVMGTLATETLFVGIDVVATAIGIWLVLQRHPRMRRFWLIVLGCYCLLELETLDGALSFVTGLAWFSYWVVARRPRELQLSTFWRASDGPVGEPDA